MKNDTVELTRDEIEQILDDEVIIRNGCTFKLGDSTESTSNVAQTHPKSWRQLLNGERQRIAWPRILVPTVTLADGTEENIIESVKKSMENRHKASLWIGEEQEQGDDSTVKLFVDGASCEEIKGALESNPEIEEVYFAHGFDDETIRELENKVRITLEVPQIADVPSDMAGRVNVVLRVPSYVDGVKMVTGDAVLYNEKFDEVTEWDGHKVLDGDEVILE